MKTKKGFSNSLIFTISLVILNSFIGCTSSHQPNLKDLAFGNNSANNPGNKPPSIAEENFAKEWKSKFDKTVAELERNRNLWKQNEIYDYDFVITKSAGGLTNEWNRLPILIKVRDGERISIKSVEKDKDYVIYSRTDGFEDFDTIEKLFNYLRQELENRRILEVKYHKNLGYPKSVTFIDSFKIHGYRNIVVERIEIIKNI